MILILFLSCFRSGRPNVDHIFSFDAIYTSKKEEYVPFKLLVSSSVGSIKTRYRNLDLSVYFDINVEEVFVLNGIEVICLHFFFLLPRKHRF